MVDDDLDRDDLVELIEGLAPDDRGELLREVGESLGGDGPGLSDDVVGHVRRRFVEERLTGDYEAVGERLTLSLLSKAERELAARDEPVDRLEFDVEVQLEPVDPVPGDEFCVRFCIVNGILEPICWQTCIVNGIYD